MDEQILFKISAKFKQGSKEDEEGITWLHHVLDLCRLSHTKDEWKITDKEYHEQVEDEGIVNITFEHIKD